MGKQDQQYTQSKDSPLISVSHPTRYLDKHESPEVNYTISHANEPPKQHNKNTVVMTDLTYRPQKVLTKLHPTVEKTKTKALDMTGDKTGVFERFMEKLPPDTKL